MPGPTRPELANQLLTVLRHRQMVSYVDVGSSFLLLYDVLLNTDLELQCIWRSNWTFIQVLYIIQRYLPFFDTAVMVLHHHFGVGLTPHYCSINYSISGWCFIVGIAISEMVLALRLWAVWHRDTRIGIGLVTFFLGIWITSFVVLNTFLKGMQYSTPPLARIQGCFISGGNDMLYMCWVLLMIYDSGALIMILIPGIAAYRAGGRSELLNVVYRDGAIYYAFACLLSVINVIVVVTMPQDLVHLLTSVERILHSILTSRAILHIRRVASQDTIDIDGEMPQSTVSPISTFLTTSCQASQGSTVSTTYIK